MTRIFQIVSVMAIVAALAIAQTPVAATDTTSPGEFLVHTGVSTDFVSHQPSALAGFSAKVGNIGGVPTFSTTAFETSLIKSPGQSSNQVTMTTGFLQIPYHQPHWGLYYYSQAGIVKFDVATLGTVNGGAGAYLDIGGIATKDKHHVWLSGGPRQLAIMSLQNKLTWLIELTTVFHKSE